MRMSFITILLEDVVKQYRQHFDIVALSQSSDAMPAGGVETPPD